MLAAGSGGAAMAVKMTAKWVEAVKPQAARVEVPDAILTGLYLVVQPSGGKSWAVRYRHAGKPRKATIGKYPAVDLGEARDLAKDALRRAAKGEDPAGDKRERAVRQEAAATEAKLRERDRFGVVRDRFIAEYAKPRNRGWKAVEGILKRDLIEWDSRSIHDITARDVRETLATKRLTAPIQANRLLAAVRKLFGWAVDEGIIAASPASGLKAPTAERSRDRVLSDDELRAVWNASDALDWPFGPLVKLLIWTGARRDEVGAMRWSELNLDAQTWVIPAARAKNGQALDVHLVAAAVDLLRSVPRIAGSDFVFTTNGKTAVSGYSRAKARLDELSGVSDWRLHDLRRTFASMAPRVGIGLEVIEKLLNHKSGSFSGIVGVYQRYSFTDERRRALEAWARFLEDLVEPKAANVVTLRAAP